MRKNPPSRSGILNPRILCAFALCAAGALLAMFSLAATTPAEAPRATTSVPPDPENFASTFGSNANGRAAVATLTEEALRPGVPLPPSGLDAPPGRKPGTASGANSLGNPVFANQQPAPLSVQQPAASESMPLASAAQGDWSIVSSPNTSATQGNVLSGVTCVSASECWAVGYYSTGSFAYQTLIERWDGTSWAIVSSPNTSAAQYNVLSGVTCVSASECWAVGSYYTGSFVRQTLIERWDGTSWAIVSSPNSSTTQSNLLAGVTCVSASECWAVGYYNNGHVQQTLIERWDGTSWAIVVSSPITSAAQSNILVGVTCVSASDCWAVGYDYVDLPVAQSNLQTLIERWDGTSWAIVSSPNTSATQDNRLSSVTCASASECWAVGDYANGSVSVAYQTLIERWDGTSWAIVSSPNTSITQDNILDGVTCVSASDCWAVGYYFTGTGTTYQTLIERWDATSWAIVSSPNSSTTQSNFLAGVTCASASDCWAVGYYFTGSSGVQTLTEHYTIPVQLVSVESELTHGSAGTFDIDLPLTGNPGIECRSGGANSDYTIIFTFANTLTSVRGARVVTGTGTVSSNAIDSNDAHQYIVNLTGVTNAQYIAVTLTNVKDSAGNSSISVPGPSMGVLIGDVNGDGFVLSGDYTTVRKNSGNNVDGTTFRYDINTDGFILSGDYTTVRKQSGTQLPPPPP